MRDSSLVRFALAARHPPLWARWLLAILGFVILIVAVRALTTSGEGSSNPTSSERTAEVEANREGQIVVEEDQTPHTAPLSSGIPTRAALESAITTDARNRILHGELTGPLQSVRCGSAGPLHADRRALHCTAHANGISYPFLGVVDEGARQLTWCKVDPPPTGGAEPEVPVSPRCRV
ncbi:MAG TPA: hypothetical protein VIJ33_10920 [Solirubrobacteraceae bacterium]